MSFKLFGFAAPLLLGGLYVSGALSSGYSRDVDRPQAEVMAALTDLDIREQPGEPGTDPLRSGGVIPIFQLEQTSDTMSWVVMSGDKVATRMTARFEPIDGGKHTRVTASVDRGDAPDDFVSPAFRSEAITAGLFSMALESELNELTLPEGDPEKCAELMKRFESGSMGSPDMQQQNNLADAFGDTAAAIVKISAFEAELRRNGCNTDRPAGGMKQVVTRMEPASSAPSRDRHESRDGISFEPGKPMVDLSR
jgi:hypothetical protein